MPHHASPQQAGQGPGGLFESDDLLPILRPHRTVWNSFADRPE